MWGYPTIDPSFRELLMRKCTLSNLDKNAEEVEEEGQALEYSYGHMAEAWYYLLNNEVSTNSLLNNVRIMLVREYVNYLVLKNRLALLQ